MYHAFLYLPPGKKENKNPNKIPLCPGTETLLLSGCVLQVFKPYSRLKLYYFSSLGRGSPVRCYVKEKVKCGITKPFKVLALANTRRTTYP